MIKLYGSGPGTRAAIIEWYLHELGISYESVVIDLQAGEQHKPEYRAINPIGKVPAMDDNGTKVWESGAILLYVEDKYGKAPKTPEARAELSAWVMYANATLTPVVADEKLREAQLDRVVKPLDEVLSGRQFLVGNGLTAADVAVASVLGWSAMLLKVDYGAYPAAMAYVGRMAQRPAFQKAFNAAFGAR
jgi:glutathione S-transferase